MKKIIFVITFALCSFSGVIAQSNTCQELINYVEQKGTSKEDIENYHFQNSSWLYSVKSYTVNNKIVVIAGIKNNGYVNKYIFCDIPSDVWETFYRSRVFILKETLGERFHKSIFQYKCACK